MSPLELLDSTGTCQYDNLATTSQVLKGSQQKNRTENIDTEQGHIEMFMSLYLSACLVQEESNGVLQLSVHGCCILTTMSV